MYKYIVEYIQDCKYHKGLELKHHGENKWICSFNYYGSGTRANSPIVYTHGPGDIVIYKTFRFILKRVNIQDSTEKILTDCVVGNDIIRDQIGTGSPLILIPTIVIKIDGIGEISFGIRDLYRWENQPGEICRCILKLN